MVERGNQIYIYYIKVSTQILGYEYYKLVQHHAIILHAIITLYLLVSIHKKINQFQTQYFLSFFLLRLHEIITRILFIDYNEKFREAFRQFIPFEKLNNFK